LQTRRQQNNKDKRVAATQWQHWTLLSTVHCSNILMRLQKQHSFQVSRP
jgi:hypothetical protein